jgi:hypothetical protein
MLKLRVPQATINHTSLLKTFKLGLARLVTLNSVSLPWAPENDTDILSSVLLLSIAKKVDTDIARRNG